MTKLSFLTCEKYKVSTLGQIETTSAIIHNLFLIPSHKIRLVDKYARGNISLTSLQNCLDLIYNNSQLDMRQLNQIYSQTAKSL